MSLAAPWNALDDEALLAHFRQPRGVQVDLVVDAEECTPERLAGVMDGVFSFAGETHALGERFDWCTNPSADVEWHILLHKFYYAPGLAQRFVQTGDVRAARRWAELVDDWIAQVPPGFIAADVTGRRVQNWLYAAHAFARHGAPIAPAFWRRLLDSLHEQVEYLCAHLTPKRNHRTLELYAIFLAGVALPEMERAAHWRRFALAETRANLDADLLPDGVHCELSTDYHCLALRNWMHVRTLARANGEPLPEGFDDRLQRAFDFALHVHQPDGGMPAFSDGDPRGFTALLADGARAFDRPDLAWVATQGAGGRAPAVRNAHFRAAGYHVLRSDWDAPLPQHLVFDCGPLGEGNHGHFDALSLELFAQGRPLLVDPGRCTYSEAGRVNWRVRFRHTAAHNTVCVDGLPQTRYEPRPLKDPGRHGAGAVRHRIAGPAPDTVLLEQFESPALDLLHGRAASHAYDALHERIVVFVGQSYWIVSDRLRAPSPHRYVQTWQLGAGLAARLQGHTLKAPGLTLVQAARAGQALRLEPGWVSRRYGECEAAAALKTEVHAAVADIDTVIWPGADAPVTVQCVPVDGSAHEALLIESGGRTDGWLHAGRHGRWRVGPVDFTGRWAHWRCDAAGRLLQVTSA